MDPKSSIIYNVKDEQEAIERGLVPIPEGEEPKVLKMNRHQRRVWASQQRKIKK